jgi:hypothetical protein
MLQAALKMQCQCKMNVPPTKISLGELNDSTPKNYIFSVWAEIVYPISVTLHKTALLSGHFFLVMSAHVITQVVANGLR